MLWPLCVRWAIRIRYLSVHCATVPSKHAEHTHKELMRTLCIRIRKLCVHWAYASWTYACTEHMHQVPLRAKHKRSLQKMLSIGVRNCCLHWAYASGAYACTEHAYAQQGHKKINDAYLPPKLKKKLYFSPKVAYPARLYGIKNHENPAIENLKLGNSYSNCKSLYFFLPSDLSSND